MIIVCRKLLINVPDDLRIVPPASTVKTLAEVLQARGYHVVAANGAELMKKAVSEKPDIIILNSMLSEKQEVVKSLRFEKGLEDVLFLVYQ